MSHAYSTTDVETTLTDALPESAKILTDIEDRFVYANERYLETADLVTDESLMPDLVVRVKSSADADTARRVLEDHGIAPRFRNGWHPSETDTDRPTALIDATDTYHLPVDLDSQTRAMDLADMRFEHPYDASVYTRDRIEASSLTKGYCPINQTVYGDVETYSAKGRLMISRQLTDAEGTIEHSKKVSQILYSCATCGNCFRDLSGDLGNMWEGLIAGKQEIIEDRDGKIPSTIRKMLDDTFRKGNPLGEARTKRADWAEDADVDVPILEAGDSAEILLFVGCQPSYDPRNQAIAASLARIFDALDLDWGILGTAEQCSGNHQRAVGEEGLFEYLVEENGAAMADIEFETLVAADPHSYHSFENVYGDYGVEVDALHYTQFLVDRLDLDALGDPDAEPKRVTYHDSCYLGTHNDVTAEPRELLDALPGYEFVDIESAALCCGGGGGRMWFEDDEVERRPAEPVVDLAIAADADVLAVACPFCITNFEDALKVRDQEDAFDVKDISELVAEALTNAAT